MAEGTATDLLRPAAEEIGRNIVMLIKRQFNYMCCFKSNVRDLKHESKNLEDARVGLEKQINEEINNAREVLPVVETWLNKTREIENNARRIHNESASIQMGFFAVKSRFALSREAKKMTENIKGLLDQHGKFDNLSVAAPSAATASIPLEQTIEFPSRKQIEEDVMGALMDDKVNLIGICGMGGVGKTTLASTLRYTAKERGLFNETVKVIVGQEIDIMKIQLEVAECLGLKEMNNLGSLQARAHELRIRLRGTRRTLIILDDIWAEISLAELGIPCESGFTNCKVILTSRKKNVLNLMKAKIFEMNVLHPKEAWSLFRESVGSYADDPDLRCIAEDVVEECEGLPLAIINVGTVLRDKEKHIWEDALHRLRSSNPRNMPEVLEKVYKPIRLSVDYLKDNDAKSLLLLCSQFPEDSDISLEDLTLYSFGQDILEGVDSLRQARNSVVAAINKLKNSFLLMDGGVEDQVRMHDVIRDVARFIAVEEGRVDTRIGSKGQTDSDCKWIFAFVDTSGKFLARLASSNFPSLRIFLVQTQRGRWDASHSVDDFKFMERMQELNVISIRNFTFEALPQTIKVMKNLRTLQLMYCNLTDLSVIGELSSLETLSCNNCNEIWELPVEIGRLKHLRLLDLSYCKFLRKVPPGILQNFVELEELKMIESFNKWESANVIEEKRRNASLKELESLRMLTCLEIEIKDKNLVVEELCLSPCIDKYKILVGKQASDKVNNEKIIILRGFSDETKFGSWIQKLASSAHVVYLDGNGARNLNLSGVHKTIKILDIEICDYLTKLVNTPTLSRDGRVLDGFPHLETLCIFLCSRIEQVFSDGVMPRDVTFPKLKKLELKYLPNLRIFGEGIDSIEFPVLENLHIMDCEELKAFVSRKESIDSHGNECDENGDYLHLFCNKKVKFGRLKILEVQGYQNASHLWCRQIHKSFFERLEILYIHYFPNLRTLFSTSSVENLASLRRLGIARCKNMEEVFVADENHNEKEKDNGKIISRITIPKLKTLSLDDLYSLTSFSKGIECIEFPILEELQIKLCPKLVGIVSPMERTGKWEDDECNLDDGYLHLFCNKRVEFNRLKDVRICREDIRSNLWCRRIPTCFFESLENLEIFECLNLKSLFSSSVVVNLNNIKYLEIYNCKNIELVIELDTVMPENCALFPSLVNLYLRRLPLLRVFCDWKCDVEFPSLENLFIDECPQLEVLTNGTISAPKVKYVLLEAGKKRLERELNGIQDLNGFIREQIIMLPTIEQSHSSTTSDDEIEEEN